MGLMCPSQHPRWNEPGTSRSSNVKIAVVHNWLDTCHAQHHAYQPSHHWIPTRLLLLEKNNRSTIKLVLGSKLWPEAYVALSHRWPQRPEEFPQLRTTTLESFQDGILVSSLPLAFQHTIPITCDLGIRYIWIDSLCIIQNDAGDWEQEAGRMCDVYKSAFLTISLSSVITSRLPVFRSRPASYLEPTALPDGRFCCHEESSIWETEVTTTPLSTRGWTLQERLLSPRVLHLGWGQMVWECISGYMVRSSASLFSSR